MPVMTQPIYSVSWNTWVTLDASSNLSYKEKLYDFDINMNINWDMYF